ncbi:site-specific DNA-methyltransferase [Simplicispira psychrophila]|uniref:site-specific DNA-methyltransferase n=1 Tax=Simplicispira psychrophila TaxID=80882 RepID=UPI00068E01A8|nr:site-specific DNA-methyltransferase [Simplicispira psychrophila]
MSQPLLNAATPDQHKLDILRQHFPGAVETDAQGHIRINAAALQLAVDPSNPAGVQVEEDGYELRWVGKREAYHSAFVPVQKVVQPLIADSKHWDSTGNLLLRGDNLDALRLLRHSYFGKVKLIYIDPPYNTQSDSFIYRDDFSAKQSEVLAQLGYAAENIDYIKNIYGARTHSGWLSFMYPRLLLAKDLLRDDGVIFISIDDNEQAQLKILCDEVFGQECFVASIAWKKRSSPDARDTIGAVHDWILCYVKEPSLIKTAIGKMPLSADRVDAYANPDNDPRGVWASVDMTGMTGRATKDQYFSVTLPSGRTIQPPSGRSWGLAERTFQQLQADNRIWFGLTGDNVPRIKRFLNESNGQVVPSFWDMSECGSNDEAKKEINDLMGQADVFDTPKPVRLIDRLLTISTAKDEQAIVLDFFAGSATTAHAVMARNAEDGGNRQFILVQIPQPIDPKAQKEAHNFVTKTLGKTDATIFEITAERLRRAGARIEAEQAAAQQAAPPAQLEGFAPDAGTTVRTPIDTGFRVFDLVDDPDALIVQKPLQEATQADVLAMQAAIATPQPALLPRVLYNLLLAEGLPLTTPLRTVLEQQLYLAHNVALVVQAIPLDVLTDTLRALQAAGTPATYLTVYAPWVADDNFMLGIKTVAETLGYSDDKLRLRG